MRVYFIFKTEKYFPILKVLKFKFNKKRNDEKLI